jgi:Cu-Zn family superoxide dismutase
VRRRTLIFALAVGFASGLAFSQARPPLVRAQPLKKPLDGANFETRAEATIVGKSGSEMKGQAVFTAKGGFVSLRIELENAPPGVHAVHLHEKGDCSAPDAMSAGPHWNPTTQAHGQWGHGAFHLGDIGNIEVGADGKGGTSLRTDLWSIGGKPETDVVGRAVVVHAGPDDFATQPTGNAGGRIGCGVVRATN